MPIAVLPKKTKDLLGSTSVITSPVTLVKELVDNSIDAAANTIEVIISLNTIDKIEVRDNGTGIHPDDYDSLGKPGYTSKLKNFEDLRKVAGTTLGFRGQALASANTVGKITITTKTTSDPVAAILQIDPRNGGVLKQLHGSAPAGTTVSVTKLYSEIPVREQHVVKEAKKTLDRIKDLLRSYAMAKPTIRLTFKVLGNTTLNWSYSPKRNSGYEEAILQILGKDVASRCLESTASFSGRVRAQQIAEAEVNSPVSSFIFSATMWKPDVEFIRPSTQRYFSVDARPVTSTRGTMQKLVAVYSKYLAHVLRTDVKALHNAFIRVNITCPRETYDVNIEPSKDEVIFEDEQAIIGYFEALCKDVYGPLASSGMQAPLVPQVQDMTSSNYGRSPSITIEQLTGDIHNTPRIHNKTSSVSLDSELVTTQNESQPDAMNYCAKQSSSNGSPQPPMQSLQPNSTASTLARWIPINTTDLSIQRDQSNVVPFENNQLIAADVVRTLNIDNDMSADLSERVPDPKGRKKHGISRHSTPMRGLDTSSRAPLRPWPIARMNVQAGNISPPQPELRTFSITPEPEVLRHRGAPPRDLDVPSSMRYHCIQSAKSPVSNALPSGPYQSPFSSPIGEGRQQPSVSHHRQTQQPWTPPSTIQKDRNKWQNHNEPHHKTNNGLKQTTISFGNSQQQRRIRHLQKHDDTPLQTGSQVNNGDRGPSYNPLNEIPAVQNNIAKPAFDFHQENVEQVILPEHNVEYQRRVDKEDVFTRLLSTKALAVNKTMVDKEPTETTLPTGDPRAYLLKRQKSMIINEIAGKPKKFRRLKSTLLPFENIAADDQTRELISILHVSVQDLPKSLDCYKVYDMYILEGGIEEAFDTDLSEARRVEKRLDGLLSEWSEAFGERIAVKSNLSLVVEGKGVSIGLNNRQNYTLER